MNLNELTIPWFYTIDDGVEACFGERRFRPRGPTSEMDDNEVIMMKIIRGL